MSSGSSSLEKRIHESLIVIGLGIALSMWFWLDLWLGGGLIGGDIYTYYFPQKAFYSDMLKQGELPLWNSWVGHGYPVVGESQTSVFYPPTWLAYRFFSLNTAYNIIHLLHYLFAFFAMALLAREVQLSLTAALLAAVVFVYGWFPPRCCLEWAIVTGAWLPFCLWLLLRYLRTENLWYVWGLALCSGLQLLAGHYNLAFITFLALGSWVLLDHVRFWKMKKQTSPEVETVDRGTRSAGSRSVRRLLFPFLAMGLAFLLAAVQLVPTWSLKQQSQRQTATSESFTPGYGHLPPVYLSQIFLPWYWYQSPEKLSEALHSEHMLSISAGTNPVEAHLYFGLLPLALAVVGGCSLIRRKDLADRQLRWAGALGLLGMIYATGWLLPLTIHLPGFSYFSGPGRFGLLTTLAVALWAGRGWEVLRQRLPVSVSGMVWGIILLLTVLDFSWVSQRITYAFMVPDSPIPLREQSEVGKLLRDQLPPARLYAPGANLPTITGVAATPVYLGIGPAEYFDPELKLPPGNVQTENEPFGAALTPEQISWLQRAGVTHVLGFAPPDPGQTELRLIWSGFDPFLNRAWGRLQEPLYLSELSDSRGRASWLKQSTSVETDSAARESIRWKQYSPQRIQLEVERAIDDTLILTDLFDKDWRVQVDGEPAPILQMEGMYRGVQLPAGHHKLEFTYQPRSVCVGGGLTIAAFTILFASACIIFWTKIKTAKC